MDGLYAKWPGITKWSPTYFREVHGNKRILYHISKTNIHPDLTTPDLKRVAPRSTTMAQFVDLIGPSAEPDSRAKYFLTGDRQTSLLLANGCVNESYADLLLDIEIPGFLATRTFSVGLWLNARNACSWLHYDSGGLHNINVQIAGSKMLLLFPPDQLSRLYPFPVSSLRGVNFSRVNVEAPDHGHFPLYRLASAYTGILRPGDALYLPAFWFHSFKGIAEFNSNVNFWWSSERQSATMPAVRSAYSYLATACLKQNRQSEAEKSDIVARDVLGDIFDELERRLCASGTVDYF